METLSTQPNIAQWRSLLKESNYASWFQSPEAYALHQATPGYQAFALSVQLNNALTGLVTGYACGSLLTRRCVVQGGLLLGKTASTKTVQTLLQGLCTLAKNCVYIELRNEYDYSAYKQVFADYGFEYRPHLNVLISCDSEPQMMQRLSENRRRQISTALQAEYTVKWAETNDETESFYRMLRHYYLHYIRKPLPPFAFFKHLVNEQSGRLLLLYKQQQLQAGMLLTILPTKKVYDYYVCSNHNNPHAAAYLYWQVMLYALQSGLPVFDTLGAGEPGVAYGVRDFKQRFGGETVEYGRFLKINKALPYRIGKKVLDLVSKLK